MHLLQNNHLCYGLSKVRNLRMPFRRHLLTSQAGAALYGQAKVTNARLVRPVHLQELGLCAAMLAWDAR